MLLPRQLASANCVQRRLPVPARRHVRPRAAADQQQQQQQKAFPSIREAPLIRLRLEDGQIAQLPTAPGVYAVFSSAEQRTPEYIGLSRRVDASLAHHMQELPELTQAVKVLGISQATRESLTLAWKQWVEETGAHPSMRQLSQPCLHSLLPSLLCVLRTEGFSPACTQLGTQAQSLQGTLRVSGSGRLARSSPPSQTCA